MQFYYEIKYKKGKENIVADSLSQYVDGELHNLTSIILSEELMSRIQQGRHEDVHL